MHSLFNRSLFIMALCLPVLPLQASEIKNPTVLESFTPHKALYEVKLESTRSGSQIANISGQMFYEWSADCEAWTSNHRFNLLYEYADSEPLRITSDFSIFESFDGQTLNFTSQRKQNGEPFEELRGQAILDKTGAGEAAYTMPKDLAYKLPKGTLFPMGHSIAAAQKMKEGKKFFNAVIFDGSDNEGPVEVNAFIGKPVNGLAAAKAAADDQATSLDEKLLQSPAQEVRLAFFPLNDSSATSDYEMTVNLHENSVISNMYIEYDDFSISQNLIALEPVEKTCVKDIPEGTNPP